MGLAGALCRDELWRDPTSTDARLDDPVDSDEDLVGASDRNARLCGGCCFEPSSIGFFQIACRLSLALCRLATLPGYDSTGIKYVGSIV
jgi:hypothetical protein